MITIFPVNAPRVRRTAIALPRATECFMESAAKQECNTPVAIESSARRHAMVVLAMLAVIGSGVPALGATSSSVSVYHRGIRLQDEIVLVSTRALCGSCVPESLQRRMRFETYSVCDDVGNRRWVQTDLTSVAEAGPAVRTLVFVHGNQISASDAKLQGLAVYRRLARLCDGDEPIRFVIFSWPSDRIQGLLRDVRVKAARTGPAGCQLAWLIDQMPSETQLSLVGFSFGARIITGALHILGGGRLGGCELVERVHPDRAPVNVVLMSAALHAHWLGEGRYHGLAMTQVDQMLLLNNCADLAMRYYRLIDRSRPAALGYRGPTCLSSYYRSKIHMRDMSRQIGSEHDLSCFLNSPIAMAMTWDYAIRSDIAEPAVARR